MKEKKGGKKEDTKERAAQEKLALICEMYPVDVGTETL